MTHYTGGAKRVEGLTEKRAKVVLTYLRGLGNHRNSLMWALGITTGLRISDLLSLRLADFLTPDGELAGSITIKEQKTGQGRTIILAPVVIEALQTYRDSITKGELMFAITREQARRLIKQWCDDCGLRGNYGTHTMRKTFATVAYDNSGGDPVLTARVTGHSNPSQLMAYIGRKPASEERVWAAVGASFS